MAPRTVEKGRTSRPFSRSRIAKPSSSLCLRLGGLFLAAAMRLALEDAGRLAAPSAQVIELGPAHLAAAHDLDRVDHRRVEREHALDALAVRDLAHREALVEAVTGAADAYALVGLHAGALALHHLDVDDKRVARGEIGDVLAGGKLRHLLFFELFDQIHGMSPSAAPRSVGRPAVFGAASTIKFRPCHPRGRPPGAGKPLISWSDGPPTGPADAPASAFRPAPAARPLPC